MLKWLIGSDKQIFDHKIDIFLSISFNICFGS